MAMAPSSSAVSFQARPAAGGAAVRPRAAAAGAGVVRASAAGAAAEAGGKWWAPLLGWSGKADYLEAPAPVVVAAQHDGAAAAAAAAARRQFVGGLTEEKARELRARMAQTESFHDAMYHSAIASRLARSA
ncbi:unnamed protein product [Urochloa decumbens]|uniref:Uncharacterized protein n=1 Tax=Urochloa decumbens TaxID=240449 RepID=A0ABC8VRG5_9POAL